MADEETAFGGPAADDFLSAAVVWNAAAVAGCAETPGLALLAASRLAAAIGVAFGAAVAAGVAEFGLGFGEFEVTGETLLLSRSLVTSLAMANPVSGGPPVCAAAVAEASEGTAGAGAATSAAEPALGASSAAVRLPGVELVPLRSLDWKAAACFAVEGSGSGAKLSSMTRDCGVGITVGAGVGAENVSGAKLNAGLAAGT